MAKFLGKYMDERGEYGAQMEIYVERSIYIETPLGRTVTYRYSGPEYELENLNSGGAFEHLHVPVTPGIDEIKTKKGCQNADLIKVDFSDEKSLQKLNFRHSYMSETNFRDCDLTGCNFDSSGSFRGNAFQILAQ